MREIRVVLGDGHRSFLDALAMRLDAECGLDVVGTVCEPEEALNVVRAHSVDVAVLTVDGDGFVGVGRRLLEIRPDLKLVGVTGGDDTAALVHAVRQGFRAWVSKDVGICVLLDVLYAVCRGETWIPPMLLTRLLQRLLEEREEQRVAELPLAALTAREQQVLRTMAGGATRDEIAEQLSISANTVRTHTQSILNKLGVHSSLAAVTLARKAGVA
ncbi:response regulator transcription factor [Geodermatophilus ruber]|uniref:Two component transcriptional regulator, LuxR family n=1 Tax=Geodermatophilus ruber TaxID=504800 RepID=A0A1I4G6T5_9ACTN|nr:response regulator transcription factor [Geodermatophilus ruber]SFL25539.1 two component transcriptional regulator, LuxR family [Geodermatophilus ruber]